jgi:hypothetical protein
MIQQCQSETEQTPIAAVEGVNAFDPILSNRDAVQIDDPQVSQASRSHQIAQAFWIRHVTLMMDHY